ncbi:hypothetical protein ANN_23080 [Periplaneta americana]|uniref:Reverse transcriptase domain-containing protein n=1 Tax=Periplaneta americana TaxID=6978 RepID=A0ABQ8SK32_PERAM|nr:hypothetical protein ANN_23080 [Periplaneta americana]
MFEEDPQTIRENTGILLVASKEIGLEVNPEKTKYMIMSRDLNIVRNGNIKIEHLSFQKVKQLKYLGATVTNTNDTREEIIPEDRDEIKDSSIWVSIDETPDKKVDLLVMGGNEPPCSLKATTSKEEQHFFGELIYDGTTVAENFKSSKLLSAARYRNIKTRSETDTICVSEFLLHDETFRWTARYVLTMVKITIKTFDSELLGHLLQYNAIRIWIYAETKRKEENRKDLTMLGLQ